LILQGLHHKTVLYNFFKNAIFFHDWSMIMDESKIILNVFVLFWIILVFLWRESLLVLNQFCYAAVAKSTTIRKITNVKLTFLINIRNFERCDGVHCAMCMHKCKDSTFCKVYIQFWNLRGTRRSRFFFLVISSWHQDSAKHNFLLSESRLGC